MSRAPKFVQHGAVAIEHNHTHYLHNAAQCSDGYITAITAAQKPNANINKHWTKYLGSRDGMH